MEKMEDRENIKKKENINPITLYLSLKTLYLSARWLKTLIFTAFVTAVEKIVTYALGDHDPGSGSAQAGRTSREMLSHLPLLSLLISRLLDSTLSWIGCDYLVIFSYLTFATLHCISSAITFALYHTCWTLSCPELAALVFSFLLHHQNALAKLSQLLGHRQQSFQAKSIRSFGLLIAEVISLNLASNPKLVLVLIKLAIG